jgi:hypothetical protein
MSKTVVAGRCLPSPQMRFFPSPQMRFFLFLLAFCLLSRPERATAQGLTQSDKMQLQQREDSLKKFAEGLVYSENTAERLRSDSQFVRALVRSLRVPNSFYYPFDSLETISRLYSPDSVFRIFTWQLKKDQDFYLQEGAIQKNMPDGSLKLFPLFDASMFTAKPLDSVRTRKNWIGAIYYRIILKTYNGRKYYTLLGFDDYSISSNKKWMEVLTFNDRGEPVFGGPYISFRGDSARKGLQYRFNIEYKKESATQLNYDPQMDMIIFDHLIPEGDEASRKDTYIPDGDFEGFKWQDGRWVHVDKVFNTTLKDGDFPMDARILDESGKPNEQQLTEQTEKNLRKEGKKPARKSGN